MNKHLDKLEDDDFLKRSPGIEESMADMAKSIAKIAESLSKSLERYEKQHDELIRTIRDYNEQSCGIDGMHSLVEALLKDGFAKQRKLKDIKFEQ